MFARSFRISLGGRAALQDTGTKFTRSFYDPGATGMSMTGMTGVSEMLWQERLRKLQNRKSKYRRISAADRRNNSQAALAADQDRVVPACFAACSRVQNVIREVTTQSFFWRSAGRSKVCMLGRP